ncbi:hypothetical protein R3P38DRAFT_2827338 [Favolaschia claudopus]|uniref:HPt domain-containing protein n=1 Tax=Favolaschia claudopus TaxID=2862362 RepID=A0AAW0EIA8_9AGAR
MEKVTEIWTPTGVKSTLKLSMEPSTGQTLRPTHVGVPGLQHTGICGFGWRFASIVTAQSAATVVDDAGNNVESFQVQLHFDAHLIRSASYGTLTLTVEVDNLISSNPTPPSFRLDLPRNGGAQLLASYVYASTAPQPLLSITVTFPTSLGLSLPHPLESRMETVLEETLSGQELVDIKFYAFSRRGTECVTHPLPLFARRDLLRGFSDDLDALLTQQGFAESSVVDLDSYESKEPSFDDFGYDSDSDLDSEEPEAEEDARMPAIEPTPQEEEGNAAAQDAKLQVVPASGPLVRQGARMGRVFVLKDTAYRTWKALLYYLYTRRINFRPLKSEGLQEETCIGPVCSPKSMYRLADKLGLEELRGLALESISSRLSEHNILQEVFSSFTSTYPVIQELEVRFLTSNFSEKASEGLKEMTEKICQGEKPYCAETLFKILHELSGKSK